MYSTEPILTRSAYYFPSIAVCPKEYFPPLETVELHENLSEEDLSRVPSLKENINFKLYTSDAIVELKSDQIAEFYWVPIAQNFISKCAYVKMGKQLVYRVIFGQKDAGSWN